MGFDCSWNVLFQKHWKIEVVSMDDHIRVGVKCINCGHEHCMTCKMCHRCGCIHYTLEKEKRGGIFGKLRKKKE